MAVEAYNINIVGLSNKIHHFQFEVGNEFFEQLGTGLISEGQFSVALLVDKHETFIEVTFTIKGTAKLICDRSLDPFDHPIDTQHKLMFKFGEEDQELSDEIIIINRETVTLALGQYIYEFIGLSIPMKKLHPRFQQEEDADDESEGKIIYSSAQSPNGDNDNNEPTDPRWDVLKKLK